MTPIEGLRRIFEEHRFFKDMRPEHVELIAGCASNVAFHDGEVLFREGDGADTFFVLRQGRIALELEAPGSGPVIIQTCGEGEVVGWSWLVGQHQWHYTGRAVKHTRAIAVDGACLRKKCEENHDLGYELLKRVADIIAHRLEATRLQLLDLYASKP
jgi:CRP-like cAMP-binding protein